MAGRYKAKRIQAGHYIYRGYEINCCGYFGPERSIVWEAYDEFGCAWAHAYTLREVKQYIDYELDKVV